MKLSVRSAVRASGIDHDKYVVAMRHGGSVYLCRREHYNGRGAIDGPAVYVGSGDAIFYACMMRELPKLERIDWPDEAQVSRIRADALQRLRDAEIWAEACTEEPLGAL